MKLVIKGIIGGIASFLLVLGVITYANEWKKISVTTATEEETSKIDVVCVYTNGEEDTMKIAMLPSSYLRLNGNGCLERVDSYAPYNPQDGHFVRCGLRYFIIL